MGRGISLRETRDQTQQPTPKLTRKRGYPHLRPFSPSSTHKTQSPRPFLSLSFFTPSLYLQSPFFAFHSPIGAAGLAGAGGDASQEASRAELILQGLVEVGLAGGDLAEDVGRLLDLLHRLLLHTPLLLADFHTVVLLEVLAERTGLDLR